MSEELSRSGENSFYYGFVKPHGNDLSRRRSGLNNRGHRRVRGMISVSSYLRSISRGIYRFYQSS